MMLKKVADEARKVFDDDCLTCKNDELDLKLIPFSFIKLIPFGSVANLTHSSVVKFLLVIQL